MRLSFIFELLLIFVFLAFAASRVIDSKGLHNIRTKSLLRKRNKISHKVRQEDAINRYCSCSTSICNCCREFNIPAVSLKGPGCASLQYLNGDKLAISMSFGDRVLTNTTINSRRPRPICMPLPGGVSKFCGRVYNIGRQGQDFNACLGLELKALKNVEAALRVSCFRFGSEGLKVQPSQPLPAVEANTDEDDDDDDDDYDDEDDFGFDDDDDDDDDEEDEDDDDNDLESTDYETFSLLDDDFIDGLFTSEGDDTESKPVKKVSTTTKAPLRKATRKPLRKVTYKPTPIKRVTGKPTTTLSTSINSIKKVQTITASPVISVTSATVVQSEKKPELIIPITNVSINEIPDSTLVELPIPDQNSVVTLISTSDSPPLDMDTPLVKPINDITVPEPVNVVSSVLNKFESTEILPNDAHPSIQDFSEQASTDSFSEVIVQHVTSDNTIAQDSETLTDEKFVTTETIIVDEDEEENEEPVQSFIVKNDDDDGEEDEDEDDESDESDPITDVVEDVLGVDEEKGEKKKNESKVENVKNDGNKEEESSSETKDVVDDIIDGTVDMISITDDSDEDTAIATTKNQSKKDESDEDDILDDDDDDDDDEDDDDDDDDSEDEEDEARKAKSNNRRKAKFDKRQSRDMWLDRLHW